MLNYCKCFDDDNKEDQFQTEFKTFSFNLIYIYTICLDTKKTLKSFHVQIRLSLRIQTKLYKDKWLQNVTTSMYFADLFAFMQKKDKTDLSKTSL